MLKVIGCLTGGCAALMLMALPISAHAKYGTSVRVLAKKDNMFTEPVGHINNLRVNRKYSNGRFEPLGRFRSQSVVLAKAPGTVYMTPLNMLAVPIRPGESYVKTSATLIGRTDYLSKRSKVRLLLFAPDGVHMQVSVGKQGARQTTWKTYTPDFFGLDHPTR